MKLGVMSDTHGSLSHFNKALKVLNVVDRYVHLGDFLYHGPRNPLPDGYNPKELVKELKKIKYSYVTGNCDAQIDNYVLGLPEVKPYTIESYGNFKILMTHGFAPTIEEAIELAKRNNCDVLMHGHTHISKIEEIDNLIIFNPGSTALPKENTPNSVGKISINNNTMILELIDLETGNTYERKEINK